jgi:hypothetical protein
VGWEQSLSGPPQAHAKVVGQNFLYIFYSNLQIYTTVLKFIKNIHQPPWRTVVVYNS